VNDLSVTAPWAFPVESVPGAVGRLSVPGTSDRILTEDCMVRCPEKKAPETVRRTRVRRRETMTGKEPGLIGWVP